MQADRHHFRRAGPAFGEKDVEGIAQIDEKLIAGIETLGRGETHVVGVERIGDDKLFTVAAIVPIGQIVGIGIGCVDETAFFGDQFKRVHGTAPGIPAKRPRSGDFGVNGDCLAHVPALRILGKIPVFDPFQPVRGDLPAGLAHCRDLAGRALQGGSDAEDGNGKMSFGEQSPQPPEAGAGAIFVNRFHIPVALAGPWRGADDLRQKGFGSRVAVQNAVLAAFLVVDDELDGDIRAVRPLRIGWRAAVAAHVAGIGLVHGDGFSPVSPQSPIHSDLQSLGLKRAQAIVRALWFHHHDLLANPVAGNGDVTERRWQAD